MAQWQLGDMSAFESLYRENEDQVFKTAYLMSGSKQEAEDICQEVFMSVWRSRETFDPARAKLTTWLHRITFNACLNNNHRKGTADINLEGLDFPEPANRQPEEIMVTKYEYEKLLGTLASMDKKHRSVLVLRYFNDLHYSEIADVLNIPLGTVKSRLNQALGCLREQMAPEKAGA